CRCLRRRPIMATTAKTSLPDLLYQAACTLGQEFSTEELVVAAHKLYPGQFSLMGYPQHPDSNKVISYLCGDRSLVAKGWLAKCGPKRFLLLPRPGDWKSDYRPAGHGQANGQTDPTLPPGDARDLVARPTRQEVL